MWTWATYAFTRVSELSLAKWSGSPYTDGYGGDPHRFFDVARVRKDSRRRHHYALKRNFAERRAELLDYLARNSA